MEITNEMVAKLAHLSKLKFDEAAAEKIKVDLQNMVGFIEKMNEVNTDNVTPLLHMTDAVNVMRNDVLQGSISNEAALHNAAQSKASYFVVPKVIKK